MEKKIQTLSSRESATKQTIYVYTTYVAVKQVVHTASKECVRICAHVFLAPIILRDGEQFSVLSPQFAIEGGRSLSRLLMFANKFGRVILVRQAVAKTRLQGFLDGVVSAAASLSKLQDCCRLPTVKGSSLPWIEQFFSPPCNSLRRSWRARKKMCTT